MRRIGPVLLTLIVAVGGVVPSAASARTNVLPEATYVAITGALEAFVALDAAGKNDVPTKQDYAAVRKACDAVPQTDALLRSQRELCTATLRLHREFDRDCEPRRGCPRLFARSAAAAKRVNALKVRGNRIIDRAVPAGRCRATLRSSAADLRFGRTVERTLRDLDIALRADDDAAYERALAGLFRTLTRQTSTPTTELEAFRAHC